MRIVGWFFPLGHRPARHFMPSDVHQLSGALSKVSVATDATSVSDQTSTGLRAI